jgi:pyruvate,water dikinase
MSTASGYVKFFDEITIGDVATVGGKNASLGEMFRELRPRGIAVPDGFAITAAAYRDYLEHNDLKGFLQRRLSGLEHSDTVALQAAGLEIRQAITAGRLPKALSDAVLQAYQRLSGGSGALVDVAVRSSATAEDLPDASFAGQQETYLNVQGAEALLATVTRCFASLFTDRAISYRDKHGFAHMKVALSIGVQKMVRSDLGASGVMFSIDTETGFPDVVLINSSWGLGETVVQGTVNPDEFYVHKPTLKAGFRPILQRRLGSKEVKLVYDVGGGRMVKSVPVPEPERDRLSITDDDVIKLALWAVQIEEHYSVKRGLPTPMDMEWAKDGRTGELFIVQARPETVESRRSKAAHETFQLLESGTPVLKGRSVGAKIGQGPVRIVHDVSELKSVEQGDVLVADRTDPDWEPAMRKASALITNRGGRTCHAAIVSRELGLPAVVGTETATSALANGDPVTVSCAAGEVGSVYPGILRFERRVTDLGSLARPRTKVLVNVANPAEAMRIAQLPNDGVGLAREEFIVTNYIKVHPLALIGYETLEDRKAKAEIAALTRGYAADAKPQYFVDKLAEGAAMIAAAFYPRDVILRFSDFKTNEYADLLGGKPFEPTEENPMLGFRGASRYYHPRYREGFALECRGIKRVRDEMGLTNLKVMIPFCRTVEEGRLVLAEMAANGLKRGENGLEVYVMCEIPSNVILAEAFAEIFDGFSIGSNDLTQLILGVDRDSEIVAPLFDERNPAVTTMIRTVIRAARQAGRKIGICGQAPSDYPEFARFLVEEGIDSISLNPDAVVKTTLNVLETERQLART